MGSWSINTEVRGSPRKEETEGEVLTSPFLSPVPLIAVGLGRGGGLL